MRERPALAALFAAALALLTAAVSPFACALDDTLDASQYAHAAWRMPEGFPRSPVRAYAQTPDGYIWMGTDEGLVRFDGVRGMAWPPGRAVRGERIRALFAARDGTLWIGTLDGLATLRGERVEPWPQLAGHIVNTIIQGPDATVWVGTHTARGARLCSIRDREVGCDDGGGRLGAFVMSFCEDGKGAIWAGVSQGLLRIHPAPVELHAIPFTLVGSLQGLACAPDGSVLVLTRQGIVRYTEGRAEPHALMRTGDDPPGNRLLADRDGGLWVATSNDGLLHVHKGRIDSVTIADGFSADTVGTLFEDREGNIWVSTTAGLDRFSARPIAPFGRRQGLSSATVAAIVAARDGSVWFATRDFVNRWQGGRMTAYRGNDAPRGLVSLFEDSRGRMWAGGLARIGYFTNELWVTVADIPGGFVDAFAEDSAGNIWVSVRQHGLFRRSPKGEVARIALEGIAGAEGPSRLAADPVEGIWVGFREGGVSHLVDGRVAYSHGRGAGLARGFVHALRVEGDGTVWFGNASGLHRLKDGRVSTLGAANGLPCEYVDWITEDAAGDFWIYMGCGLLRIDRRERESWSAAADRGETKARPVRFAMLDIGDGVVAGTDTGTYGPHAARSADGKLWFATATGALLLDPGRMRANPVPPPVHIEQVVADRKVFAVESGAPLELPVLVRDVQVDYTALSFSAPEKVVFRHRLEGRDAGWSDAGTRRQAFYTDLPPGDYRFHVIAANNSGVWNETGATLAFSIPPAYHQTTWFRAGLAVAAIALLWMLHLLRLRRLRRQFEMRVRERVGERTRIARELHDTLLQTFQGTLLSFQAAASMLPGDPTGAKRKLEQVIDRAAEAVTEGRDTVQGLRASTTVSNDLAEDLARLGTELGAGEDAPALRVHVKGEPRELVPLVRDEVHRIAGEAVRNAFRHSRARHIDVHVDYERRKLALRVRDDGTGIPADILRAGGRAGHYGLAGMEERAQLAGGTLTVRSGPGLGTEVTLEIPGANAYAKARSSRTRTDV